MKARRYAARPFRQIFSMMAVAMTTTNPITLTRSDDLELPRLLESQPDRRAQRPAVAVELKTFVAQVPVTSKSVARAPGETRIVLHRPFALMTWEAAARAFRSLGLQRPLSTASFDGTLPAF